MIFIIMFMLLLFSKAIAYKLVLQFLLENHFDTYIVFGPIIPNDFSLFFFFEHLLLQ